MLQVFRVEYVLLRTKESWKTTIVSYSRKEVEKLIVSLVKSPINIVGFEVLAKVDGIADDVIEKIVSKYRPVVEAEVRTELESALPKKETKKSAPKKKQQQSGKRSIRKK